MSTAFTFDLDVPAPTAVVERDNGFAMPPPRQRPKDFREHFRALSPLTLLGPVAVRLTGAFGLMFDALSTATMLAVLARNMLSEEYPRDALPITGAERSLFRLPNESHASYFDRVFHAWEVWEKAGTDPSLVDAFAAGGLTIEIQPATEWDWDGRTEDWSRIWVVITGGHAYADEGEWGDGRVYGDGGTWGSTAPLSFVRMVRKLVRDFKPGHVRAMIVLSFVGDLYDEPDGTWGEPENRSPNAAYLDG